jgi:8-oxo-dGTP pyrophosphatase MutT (NUDIX family)
VRARIAERLARFTPTPAPLDGRRSAAVAVVLAGADDDLGVWLTRRSAGLRAHAGQIALPGGRFDEGEDAVAAALRELREELGIALSRTDVLGVLDDYPTRSGYVITPVVLWAGTGHEVTPNPDEVAVVDRVSLADLDIEPRFISIPESDRPVIQLPVFGTLVHAPTAAVLYQFREIALHDRHTAVRDLEQPPFAWR